MRTDFFIALRYLFARKSQNVINIISIISVVGVVFGTMGLIIVLSVFNGFSDLVVTLYNSFDPDIKITAVKGKSFDPSVIDTASLRKISGVKNLSFSLEENALLKSGDRQFIATIKGVDEDFLKIANLDDKIIDGELTLTRGDHDYAVVGGGIAWSLGMSVDDPLNPLTIYVPKKGKPVSVLNPEDAFNIGLIRPAGIFAIQQDFDSKYVLIPLRFARDLIGNDSKVSSIEIGLDKVADENAVQDQLQKITGPAFNVQTRLQQHEFLYKILKSEKWAVYLILTFILIIAVFNITGSLTMLIIEKKRDIGTLKALGAEGKLVRNIFLFEGVLITMLGALAGLVLGGGICLLQQKFGLIKLDDGESFLVDAYPVSMEANDFVLVALIVFVIGLIASWYASGKLARDTKIEVV